MARFTRQGEESFSALLRAEKSEICGAGAGDGERCGFSALLRAEKSEICRSRCH